MTPVRNARYVHARSWQWSFLRIHRRVHATTIARLAVIVLSDGSLRSLPRPALRPSFDAWSVDLASTMQTLKESRRQPSSRGDAFPSKIFVKGGILTSPIGRYDRMLLHSQLSSSPDFRWCLAPGCGAGQIHPEPDHDPIFTCQNCGHRSCALCDVPWHEGQSCASHRRHRKNEQQSNDTVFNTTKACPQCRSRIEKNDGCDHMTCEYALVMLLFFFFFCLLKTFRPVAEGR